MSDCRLYLAGYRVHHGLIGLVLAAIGAVLMYHDRRDWPWRVTATDDALGRSVPLGQVR